MSKIDMNHDIRKDQTTSQQQDSLEKKSLFANTYNQNVFRNESYIKRFLKTTDGGFAVKKISRTNRNNKKPINTLTVRDTKKDNLLQQQYGDNFNLKKEDILKIINSKLIDHIIKQNAEVCPDSYSGYWMDYQKKLVLQKKEEKEIRNRDRDQQNQNRNQTTHTKVQKKPLLLQDNDFDILNEKEAEIIEQSLRNNQMYLEQGDSQSNSNINKLFMNSRNIQSLLRDEKNKDSNKLEYLSLKDNKEYKILQDKVKQASQKSQEKKCANIDNYNQLRYQFQTHHLPELNNNQLYKAQETKSSMRKTQQGQVKENNLMMAGYEVPDNSSYKFYQKHRNQNVRQQYQQKRSSSQQNQPLNTQFQIITTKNHLISQDKN